MIRLPKQNAALTVCVSSHSLERRADRRSFTLPASATQSRAKRVQYIVIHYDSPPRVPVCLCALASVDETTVCGVCWGRFIAVITSLRGSFLHAERMKKAWRWGSGGGGGGVSRVCVCVHACAWITTSFHSTSHGLISMPQALTYTPVSLFELIRPPLHRRSESPEILGTEYQFNLGVTFALHTIRMKCILARTLI